VLVLAGLPPEVQYPVVVNGRRYRLDRAYPDRITTEVQAVLLARSGR